MINQEPLDLVFYFLEDLGKEVLAHGIMFPSEGKWWSIRMFRSPFTENDSCGPLFEPPLRLRASEWTRE